MRSSRPFFVLVAALAPLVVIVACESTPSRRPTATRDPAATSAPAGSSAPSPPGTTTATTTLPSEFASSLPPGALSVPITQASCYAIADAVSSAVDSAVASADIRCTNVADCTRADYASHCPFLWACDAPLISTHEKHVNEVIAKMNAGPCTTWDANDCKTIAPMASASCAAWTKACVGGKCVEK